MNRYILAILLCLPAAACDGPHSVTTMEQSPIAYSASTHKSALAFTQCLAPKMESYPVFVSIGAADATDPVITRQTERGADLYQMMPPNQVMTLVTYRRTAHGPELALYVTPNHLAAARVKRDLSALIDTCK